MEPNDSVAAVSGRRTVVQAHRASHEDPIALRVGDLITVGRRDTTWPDYVWCTGQDGREGWVPEAFLEATGGDAATGEDATADATADVRRARRDYDARELDVAPGDVVLAGEEAGGWYWCEAADGRGWVPAECLAPSDE
jgi:hypothetical protein